MENSTSPIKLAFADDHLLFRKGLSMIIKADPEIEIVVEANNGLELLEALEKEKVDVVLLDLEMPQLNGLDTLIRIKENHRDIKTLLLTMHNDEKYMVHCLQLGANGYLVKDSDPEDLIYGIKKVHKTGKYLSDRVSDALLNRIEGLKQEQLDLDDKFQLGEREREVLQLICEEYTTAEIADKLFLSTRTIESYRKRLLEKTNARNTAGLVRVALESGIIKNPSQGD